MAKVLVVEDDSDVRELIVSTLSVKGYDVVFADNAELGLEKFQNEEPDIIITDIHMPGKDGLWLISNVRDQTSEIPIIVLSGYPESREKTLKMQVNAFLIKPFQAPMLILVLQKAIDSKK